MGVLASWGSGYCASQNICQHDFEAPVAVYETIAILGRICGVLQAPTVGILRDSVLEHPALGSRIGFNAPTGKVARKAARCFSKGSVLLDDMSLGSQKVPISSLRGLRVYYNGTWTLKVRCESLHLLGAHQHLNKYQLETCVF